MFKLSPLRLHCSNIVTPAGVVAKRVKKCPLNKTARNLYVSYITLAVTLPFSISYIHHHNSNRRVNDTLLIEEELEKEKVSGAPVKKRQHSVRYIF